MVEVVSDTDATLAPVPATPVEALQLLDWKHRVFDGYRAVRAAGGGQEAWLRWRAERDDLFANHPQSPLSERARRTFRSLPYFDHDPAARVAAEFVETEPEHLEIGTSTGGEYGFTRVGVARFELHGQPLSLEVYWVEGYGGGVFVPFRDATAGRQTYGAGRYLLDTVKGADLGFDGDRLILDFNFAYHPSCAYDPRWTCPLAPPANRSKVGIEAGERLDPDASTDSATAPAWPGR